VKEPDCSLFSCSSPTPTLLEGFAYNWRHYGPEIILLYVRAFLELPAFPSSSSRDGAGARIGSTSHNYFSRSSSNMRSDLEKRCRPHLRPRNDSWRVDETYIKIKGKDRYLCRAVDSTGQTLDFLLTAPEGCSSSSTVSPQGFESCLQSRAASN